MSSDGVRPELLSQIARLDAEEDVLRARCSLITYRYHLQVRADRTRTGPAHAAPQRSRQGRGCPGRRGVSEPRCTVVLAAAIAWAAVSATAFLDSMDHSRKAKAWLWGAHFAGASLVAAFCFGRMLVWEA